MIHLYSSHSKSINKSIHKLLYSRLVSGYFDGLELDFFPLHDSQFLETVVTQNCRNN